MNGQKVKTSEGQHSPNNEDLADQIQKEWVFKIKRVPKNIVIKFGIVNIVLTLLEVLLIISNNLQPLGYWEGFITKSSQIRDSIFPHLPLLDPYSLWRGWIVPSVLVSSTYTVVSLLSLRHELYHWKPELLQQYLDWSKELKPGQYIPESWFDFAFHIYEDKHREYIKNRIQERTHSALEDSKEFFKVLRTVALNILLSTIGELVFWIFLLRTNVESENIAQLPKSYVPPIQGIVWYLFNDLFYFYPHWIAHHSPSTDAFYYRILPRPIAKTIYTYFNRSHKLHHKTKASLGIAAWYCSPWEQIIFNTFPALIGPYLTQVLADTFHVSQTWGTHLITLYIWLIAASAMSVLAHTGYRSCFNDPGKHDLHHEHAFNPKTAVNFGTMGFFDWVHGTKSEIPKADAKAWREQRDRQAALWEASRRSGVELTKEQMEVVKQPDHSEEWVDKTI